MTIDEVPVVVIDLSYCYKFIVAKLTYPTTIATKTVVRASDVDYHIELVHRLDAELQESGIMCYCLGGGNIKVNAILKIIEIWGESGKYGQEPDRAETLRLIQAAHPDYKVMWNTESCGDL